MKVPIPNTPKYSSDPFYRYKRDTLHVEKVGEFYTLKNFELVCKQIEVDPKVVSKYFQGVLKQPIMINKNTKQYQIKSIAKPLEEVLEEFIQKNVICKRCDKPELESTLTKCKACGNLQSIT